MYNDSFWDTNLGNRLANTLCHCLPKLMEKEQYVINAENESAEELIKENIKKGASFVNAVYENGAVKLLIFEK